MFEVGHGSSIDVVAFPKPPGHLFIHRIVAAELIAPLNVLEPIEQACSPVLD